VPSRQSMPDVQATQSVYADPPVVARIEASGHGNYVANYVPEGQM
jgi:hypothetical protein